MRTVEASFPNHRMGLAGLVGPLKDRSRSPRGPPWVYLWVWSIKSPNLASLRFSDRPQPQLLSRRTLFLMWSKVANGPSCYEGPCWWGHSFFNLYEDLIVRGGGPRKRQLPAMLALLGCRRDGDIWMLETGT